MQRPYCLRIGAIEHVAAVPARLLPMAMFSVEGQLVAEVVGGLSVVALGVTNRPEAKQVPKDTARNIRRTGEFVVNVVTEDIAQKMNICATDFPAEMSEVELAGFTTVASGKVKVPRLAEAHAALECREYTTMEIGRSRIILGRVVAVYVEDRYVDPAGPYILAEDLHSIGRMNGLGNYVRTRDAFIQIPRIPFAEWKKRDSEQ